MRALRKQLLTFDGRSVEPFRRAAEWLPETPAVLDELADLAGERDEVGCEVGATWLIKHRLENASDIPDGFVERVVELLLKSAAADARLHLLQCLQFLEFDREQAARLYRPLVAWSEDGPTFVRAWAFDGLWRVRQADTRKRRAIDARLDAALENEKASIRARIRRARAGK